MDALLKLRYGARRDPYFRVHHLTTWRPSVEREAREELARRAEARHRAGQLSLFVTFAASRGEREARRLLGAARNAERLFGAAPEAEFGA